MLASELEWPEIFLDKLTESRAIEAIAAAFEVGFDPPTRESRCLGMSAIRQSYKLVTFNHFSEDRSHARNK